MVTLAAVARPLPGRGPVNVVHVENSPMAVDACFPVCGSMKRWGGGISDITTLLLHCKECACQSYYSQLDVTFSLKN